MPAGQLAVAWLLAYGHQHQDSSGFDWGQLIAVALGGLLAAVGGVATAWFVQRNESRRISQEAETEESVARRLVNAEITFNYLRIRALLDAGLTPSKGQLPDDYVA